MAQMQRTQLKTGNRPVQLNARSYKPGEVLFEEGSKGRELFIIQEGTVGVYKETPDGQIELAKVGQNGIIGEMSLLDDLPRSATIKAVDTCKAMLINESVFKKQLALAPMWLTSIVKIVVSRLRDTNKRVDQTALRDKERGIVSLIRLLLPEYRYNFDNKPTLSYDFVVVEAYYVCRLKKNEILRILTSLEKKSLIKIEEDSDHKKHLTFQDLEIIDLFYEYLVLKGEQKKFKEIDIPKEAVNLFSNVAYVAQKSGRETKDGIVLKKSILLKDLSEKKPAMVEKYLIDLRRRGCINLLPDQNDTIIIFRPEMLSRIKKIKEWMPKFSQVV